MMIMALDIVIEMKCEWTKSKKNVDKEQVCTIRTHTTWSINQHRRQNKNEPKNAFEVMKMKGHARYVTFFLLRFCMCVCFVHFSLSLSLH